MSRPHGLTVRQIAVICDVDQVTVRSWIKRGHVRRDEHGRLNALEVLAYLDQRGTVGQRKAARAHGLARRADQQKRDQS